MNYISRAARIVAQKDGGSFRQAAFAYLASHNKRVSLAKRLYQVLGKHRWPATLLVSGYGLAAFLRVNTAGNEKIWSVGRYRNEERQFSFTEECAQQPIGRVKINTAAIWRLNTVLDLVNLLASPREVLGSLRLIHQYGARGDFLISCRVAATAGFAARFRRILRRHKQLEALLVSSDTNPYATSACEVARDLGLARIYITHGHMPASPPRVDFDLWLLDGPELRDVYNRVSPVTGEVVYKGAEGEYRPMNADTPDRTELVVGVFASLLVDWNETAALIQRVHDSVKPKRIILRFHPNQTIRDPLAKRLLPNLPNLEYSDGEQLLTADAERCDLVLAGNSSCHLTLLKYGVPTAYVRGLDIVPHDFYGFLRDNIVPAYETPEEICIEDIFEFYRDPDWCQRFARYDASYGADQRLIRARVERAIERVLPGPPTTTALLESKQEPTP
jgi:hypothetical protein